MLRNIIKHVSNQGYNRITSSLSLNSVRTLYAPQGLGIDAFETTRSRVKSMLVNGTERYKQKMKDFYTEDSKNMIFTEDLKNTIHIAEKEDIPLVVSMLTKFTKQNSEVHYGNYIFGPVLMRMFYYLNDVDTALKVFKDKTYGTTFDQWITYQILCDMLYKKGRYQDVLDVYDSIEERKTDPTKFPKHTIILVYAACYKINTPESYKYAMDLWQKMVAAGHIPMRRTVTFAAGLALAQNAPQVALEILYSSKQQNYITVRNMKILAMLDMNRVDDVIPILRAALGPRDNNTKQQFCAEVLEKTKAAINSAGNEELKMDYERVETFLKQNGHVTDQTIDSFLTSEIDTSQIPQQMNKNQTFINASFSRQNNFNDRRGNRPFQQRQNFERNQGLKEMY